MTCNWDEDEFMSNWDKTYVATNLKPGANPYEKDSFTRLNDELSRRPDSAKISHCITAVACCAVGRADVVGRLFDDITAHSTPEESSQVYLLLREAIMIVYPFLGIPTCIPATYGIIGVLQRKGEAFGDAKALRKPVMDAEDVQKGKDLRAKIYSGVGNSEIFGLMDKYFTDLYNCSTNFTWGYLVSKANEEVFDLKESHLIIASAITALGATRQTRSHIKATIGIGNSVETVKAVIGVVSAIAEWGGKPFTLPDVDALAQQIRTSLAR